MKFILGLFGCLSLLAEQKGIKEEKRYPSPSCSELCFGGPILKNDWGIDLSGGVLYGTVSVGGAEVAVAATEDKSDGLILIEGVHIFNDEEYGVKVNLGYRTEFDNWGVFARNTYFSNATYPQSYEGFFYPLQYMDPHVSRMKKIEGLEGFGYLKAARKAFIDTLNLFIARPSAFTKYLTFTPYFGIDCAYFFQSQTAYFLNEYLAEPNYFIDGGGLIAYERNQFIGIGPLLGLDTKWNFNPKLYLYAGSYLSLLYSKIISFSDSVAIYKGPLESPQEHRKISANTAYQAVPELSINLGIGWNSFVINKAYNIGLKIGYEVIYYSQVNRRIINNFYSYGVTDGSSISLQGFTGEAFLDF
ncbi:MAG: Lpg1974 family pore-forming outer membrane protein [Chlamydiia bacterium]